MRQVLATALMAKIRSTFGPLMTPRYANAAPAQKVAAGTPATATPIQHLVVIFRENISFDHYFGTTRTPPILRANRSSQRLPGDADGQRLQGAACSTLNPESRTRRTDTGATNPFRLDRSQAATADQDHDYTPEQTGV